jgi:3-oxoacyl-[acyl-carrier-protein] synthase III
VLTQSHLVTRLVPRLHPAAPGLGDAAAALVLTRDATSPSASAKPTTELELLSTFAMSHGEFAPAVVMLRAEDPDEPPWWRAGGAYRMGSLAPGLVKLLMRDTVDFAAQTIREAAQRAGVDVERIAVLAAVQPRGFLPHAMAERLGLPRAAAIETYETIAHVGAVGPSVNLLAARARGAWKPGDLVAMYAQGAGFTRAAAILRVVS